MLKIKLLSVGDKMPAWVNEGSTAYLKRIRGNTRVELIEIQAGKRARHADIPRVLALEGQAILKHVSAGTRLICLDRHGREFNSLKLADRIRDWQQLGESIAFAVGGPEGIDPAVLDRADEVWSLSKLTFSHHVARVMLAEGLYRAWSITEGLPYHR